MLKKFTKQLIQYFIIVCTCSLTASYMYENKNPEIALTILAIYGTILILLIFSDVKSIKIGSFLELEKHEQENKEENDK
jgi:hypothetical protein